MKAFFPTLQENERLKQQFGEQILRGTMAHAYLIQGAKGTGKSYFAHLLAAALCCQKREQDSLPLPCGECESCRKIMADGTPDIRNITRGENATIGIDAIRLIKEDMYLSPTEQEKKIYIIHEAEKMTAAAQNALLIALEEPPANVAIFLLCEDAASLLSTVRSRVQSIRMSLFSPEQLTLFLQDNREAKRLRENDPARYQEIITAAAGSPGMALSLLQQKNITALLEERKVITDILSRINTRTQYARLHEATARLSTKRQDLIQELSSLMLAIRDLIIIKKDEDAPLCFWGNREIASETAATFSLRCLLTVFDAAREAQLQLSQNANLHTVITSLNSTLFHAPTKS